MLRSTPIATGESAVRLSEKSRCRMSWNLERMRISVEYFPTDMLRRGDYLEHFGTLKAPDVTDFAAIPESN